MPWLERDFPAETPWSPRGTGVTSLSAPNLMAPQQARLLPLAFQILPGWLLGAGPMPAPQESSLKRSRPQNHPSVFLDSQIPTLAAREALGSKDGFTNLKTFLFCPQMSEG